MSENCKQQGIKPYYNWIRKIGYHLLIRDAEVFGAYPQMATDIDGTPVPVVTTSGAYRYVGKLAVGFDRNGEVVAIDEGRSEPVRVVTGDCGRTLPCNDTVEPDPMMQALVVDPVEAAVETLAETVIGNSEVDLDGLRSSVRAVESNEGNLIADALKWQAEHKLTSNLSNSRGEWGAMK